MAQRRVKKAPRKSIPEKPALAPVERISEMDLLKLANAAQAVELAQMRHGQVVAQLAHDYKLDFASGDTINPDGAIIRK